MTDIPVIKTDLSIQLGLHTYEGYFVSSLLCTDGNLYGIEVYREKKDIVSRLMIAKGYHNKRVLLPFIPVQIVELNGFPVILNNQGYLYSYKDGDLKRIVTNSKKLVSVTCYPPYYHKLVCKDTDNKLWSITDSVSRGILTLPKNSVVNCVYQRGIIYTKNGHKMFLIDEAKTVISLYKASSDVLSVSHFWEDMIGVVTRDGTLIHMDVSTKKVHLAEKIGARSVHSKLGKYYMKDIDGVVTAVCIGQPISYTENVLCIENS